MRGFLYSCHEELHCSLLCMSSLRSRTTIPAELLLDQDLLGEIDPSDFSDKNKDRAMVQLAPFARFLFANQKLLCALHIPFHLRGPAKMHTEGNKRRRDYATDFIAQYGEQAKQVMRSKEFDWTRNEVAGAVIFNYCVN